MMTVSAVAKFSPGSPAWANKGKTEYGESVALDMYMRSSLSSTVVDPLRHNQKSPVHKVIFKNGHHLGHLREHDDTMPRRLQLGKYPIQQLHLLGCANDILVNVIIILGK